MFCGKCGAQNEDGASFCKECGAPLTADAPTPAQTPEGQGGQNVSVGGTKLPVNRNQFIGIVAVAAVVIVAIIILIVNLVGGGGSQGAAEKYVKAYFEADAKTCMSFIHQDVVEEWCDRRDIDEDEYFDEWKDQLEDMTDKLDDNYDKWSIKVEATKAKDLAKKEIKQLTENYENSLNVDFDIETAQEVTVKLTTKFDGDEGSSRIKITVFKVDGKWYVYSLYQYPCPANDMGSMHSNIVGWFNQ